MTAYDRPAVKSEWRGLMAERRMFAKAVINSARFLRMPQSSRLLYYDLGMAADDDGIVEAFTVLRTTGAAEDDLRVLVSKGFIAVLNEDLVAYITDWRQNNLIRPDRYHPSVYAELLVKIADGESWFTDGIPMVDERETQVRLGKDSIGEVSIGEGKTADKPPRAQRFRPPTLEEVSAYCRERGNSVDAQRFIDYYTANGWRVGKNPMRDWKAAVRTWERGEQNGDNRTDSRAGSGTGTVGNPAGSRFSIEYDVDGSALDGASAS